MYGPPVHTSSMGALSFSYNSGGDMIKEVNGSNTYTYSYDYENRLTSIALNGANIESNVYNPDGERIEEAIAGTNASTYFYEGSENIIASLFSGSNWQINIYANGLLLGQLMGPLIYYYQDDALGSTRLVTSSTGAILYSSGRWRFR